jgi:hypothetical protein
MPDATSWGRITTTADAPVANAAAATGNVEQIHGTLGVE